MELRKLTIDSPDIPILEEINEEAIPECERNSFRDLMNTGATILGIYDDGPVGFLVIREYRTILYLAYLAVNSSLRSKGIGGRALEELVSKYSDHMLVVEYEAPNLSSPECELNFRRKGFYKRNGFCETGYYTFYDDTEFEIGCAGMEFDAELFGEFIEHLSTIVSDHIPKPYKMNLKNVYFIIGTSYAGKSTLVKNLARKHNGIALEENYHDEKLPELDSKVFPNLTYTRDLQDWHDFIRRTPDEYVTWINNVKKECEIVELQILKEMLGKSEVQNKKIFVDTNICIETLHKISDTDHVLVMLADPEIGIHRFFDRPDPEKQFLYQLMLEEPDPQAALDNYREILTRICSKESYEELENSGFELIYRDENRTHEETVRLAEKMLRIVG